MTDASDIHSLAAAPDAEDMRALTVRQPWASLIALGVKRIETRSWGTSYRGPIAIHAGKRRPDVSRFAIREALRDHGVGEWRQLGPLDLFATDLSDLPLGAIVATATLANAVPIVDRCRYDIACVWRAPTGLIYCGDLPLGGTQQSRSIEDQRLYGDFTAGRFAWLLEDVRALPEPVPAKGRQGLWRWVAPRRASEDR